MTKPAVGILSLGCCRNLVDSEAILGRLSGKGYAIADMQEAGVAIVNTCAFIDDAKRESIEAILSLIDLKREGKLKRIIVAGCLAQRYRATLQRSFPEVDAFVGSLSLNHAERRYSLTPRHFAYLKICEGCVHSCSYCVIPRLKGRFTSLTQAEVLRKVARFNKAHLSELNVIGQDITGWGIDRTGSAGLPQLLRKMVEQSPSIGWIRLLYLYPGALLEEVLSVIRDSPRMCKYIDLPLQHVNDRILRLMNRTTTKKDILHLIARVRKVLPGAAIRTSLIVGFPSETDKEFKELCDFIEDVRFERLGAFLYSREETTPAYGFKGQIAQRVKAERFDAVMSLQQSVARSVNDAFLGRTIPVLIDEREDDHYLGRSEWDAPEVDGSVVVTSARPLSPGEFVKVRVTETREYDLIGEVMP